MRSIVANSRDVARRKQAEELRRSEQRNRAILEAYPDLMFRMSHDGEYLDFQTNNHDDRLYVSREEIVGNNIRDTLPPEVAEGALRHLARALETGEMQTYEYQLPVPAGLLYFEARFIATCGDEAICVVRDVTERKRREMDLRESEERFKTLFEHSIDTMFVHDEKGRILDCNSEACRTLGYTREELLALRVGDIATGLLSEEERKERVKRGGTLWQRVVRGDPDTFRAVHHGEHRRKDGTTFPIEVHLGGVDYGGRRLILASVRDITERREFEKRLREDEQRYRSIFEHNPDTIYSLDLEGNFLTANAACETITGYPAEELLRMSFVPLIAPEYLELTLQNFEKAAIGEPQSYENAITRRDGHRVELNVTKLPIIVDGEIIGVYGIAKDITRQKRAEAELRESEARFRAIFDQTAIGICAADLDRRLMETNAAYQEITGYSGEELVGMSTLELTHPEDRAGDTGLRRAFVSDEFDSYQREKRYIRKDGEVVWAKTTSTLVRDESGEPLFIMGVVEDVTDRRRGEEELREAEERFRGAFDGAATGMALSTPQEGRFVQVNAAMCEMLGRSKEELLASTFRDITHPDDVGASADNIGRLVSGAVESYQLEKRYIHKDGRTVWGSINASLVRDAAGHPRYLIAHIQDITERKRAEEELRESEERFRRAFEDASAGVALVSLDNHYLRVNRALCEMLGYPEEELVGKRSLDITHPDDQALSRGRARWLLAKDGRSTHSIEERYIRKDGGVVWAISEVSLIRDSRGEPSHFVSQFHDITGRRRAQKSLRASEERYRTVVERTTDGIYIYDFRTKRILESNTSLQNMLGYTPEELSSMTIYDLIANSRESIDRNTPRISERRSVFLGERRYRHKDGSLKAVESSVTLIPYGNEAEGACCIIRDITEHKTLEEQLSYQAFHDSLTGLPNRALFTERVEHALARARRRKNKVAVLFMDFDNFKDVNDSLGHDAGDRLLISIAGILRRTIRPGDTVTRLGGDEFTVLLEEVANTRGAIQVAERIEEALRAPIIIEEHELFVGVSIGITTSVSGRESPETLLRHADLAMYKAKGAGKSRHEVFTPGMEADALERLRLDSNLRRAVEQDEMKVYYQPKVNLGTDLQQQLRSSGNPAIIRTPKAAQKGESVGMEALVRWEHPERGIVYPGEFISAAEETGLIFPIGHGVLEKACRQAKVWQEQYPDGQLLVMCVNLSARQFQHLGLAQDIARVLRETGLDPRYLRLEITESVLMKEAGATLSVLEELRKLGVSLAIDDFGTGYSSLSYLKRFPADYLKIDRSFVAGIGKDPENATIVSSIITLAHALGMQVIAEGVETAEQATRLRRMGCDLAQGNYFSEPLTADAADELLARNHSTNP